MKLVEILAKELSEWPESAVCITQDDSSHLYGWIEMRPECRGGAWYSPDGKDFGMHDPGVQEEEISLASDQKKSIVTRAQWQAERDRQKGGEWKRARGRKPKYETETPQRMEVRHRDGDITQGWTSQSWNWSHNDGCPSADIMAWRIISQPQAEEVEVKDTTIGTLSYKVEIDTSEASQAIDELAAKWHQIETPFKWRDEVTELNAYIEKYTRERDALIELLASEGFALIPPMVTAKPDGLPFEEWQVGDIVEVTNVAELCNEEINVGDQLPIVRVDKSDDTVSVGLGTWSDTGSYKFIRRP